MENTVSINELERVCEFLDLDFRVYTDDKDEPICCGIIYPFEDNPEDSFVIINGQVIKNEILTSKINLLREYRQKIKILQNEIKELTKNN